MQGVGRKSTDSTSTTPPSPSHRRGIGSGVFRHRQLNQDRHEYLQVYETLNFQPKACNSKLEKLAIQASAENN